MEKSLFTLIVFSFFCFENILANNNPITLVDNSSEPLSASLSFTSELQNIVDVSCFGFSDGQATEVATGGTPPYSCLWDNGETTVTAVMLDAGLTFVTVTDATGCTAIASGTVGTPDLLVLDIVSQEDVLCNGEENGSAQVSGSGGTPGYAYSWPGGLTGSTQNNLEAGQYEVTVTDSHDCTETNLVVIGEPDELVLDLISQEDATCNGEPDGQATVQGTGGTNPYSYEWPDGNTNPSRNDLDADMYSVSVTDDNGCEDTKNVTIQEPGLLIANTSGTNESAPGASDGSATSLPFGGVQPYNYSWSNGGNTQTITNLGEGNYTVTVTDQNACFSIETVVVDVDCSLGVSAEDDQLECFGDSDGELTVNIEGQSGEVTIEWSNGETTTTISDLIAGNFSVTVTDATGCFEVVQDVNVNEPTEISLSSDNVQNTLCNGDSNGSISISAEGGTGDFSYSWSNGETTQDISNLPAGEYSVSVTDANNCQKILTESVTEPLVLVANANATNESELGAGDGSAEANPNDGTPPYQYSWNTGSIEQSISGLFPGMYSVTVTDSNGCLSVESVDVQSDGCLVTVESDISNVPCNGELNGSIDLTLSNEETGFQYTWSNGDTTQDINNLSAGNYGVTISDNMDCNIVLELEVTEPPAIELQIGVLDSPECEDSQEGSLEGTSSPKGVTYLWSNGETSNVISNLSPGNYCVTATDVNGCIQLKCFDLTSLDTFSPVAITQNISVYIDGDGNIPSIQFGDFDNGSTDNCGDISLLELSQDLDCSNLGDNTLNYVISDISGNTTQGNFIVSVIDTISPVIKVKPVEVFADESGIFPELKFNLVDDGTSDNCAIDNIELGQSIFSCDDLGMQQIAVIVTDISGNISESIIEISLRDTILPELVCPQNIEVNSCEGIEYDLPEITDNCQVSELNLLSGLPSGSSFPVGENEILFEAIDADGNKNQCSFTITVDVDLDLVVDPQSVSCFDGSDGQFSYAVSGGSGNYQIVLDPSLSDSINQIAGLYEIIVEDENGCSVSKVFEITQPDPLLVDMFEISNESSGGGGDGSISINVIGGTPGYIFSWTKDGEPFSTEEDLENLSAGVYLCTILDDNGCELITEEFVVQMESSIIDIKFDQSISIAPNPNDGNFTLKIENINPKNLKIDIFNTSGLKLTKMVLDKPTENNKISNLTLSDGLYFVRIVEGEKVALKRLLIHN